MLKPPEFWKYFQLPKCQDIQSSSFGIKGIIPYFSSRRLERVASKRCTLHKMLNSVSSDRFGVVEDRLQEAVTRKMFRETDIVRGTDKYTPRMQCRNELDTAEETLYKIALCYQHRTEENWKTIKKERRTKRFESSNRLMRFFLR